jgi:hypothetical protein
MTDKRRDVVKLEEAVAAFDAEAKVAAEAIGRLQQRRPALLLSGSDEDLKKHDDEYATIQRTHERAMARKTDAEQRLAAARETAAKAETEALKTDADVAAREAATVVKKAFAEVQKMVGKAREKLVAANQKIADANRYDSAIGSVESRVYAGYHLPEKVLSEKQVLRWVYEHSGVPVPEDKLSTIVVDKDDQHTGRLLWRADRGAAPGSYKVVCRKFLRREFLPRVHDYPMHDLEQLLDQIEELTSIKERQDDREPTVQYSRVNAATDGAGDDSEPAEEEAA